MRVITAFTALSALLACTAVEAFVIPTATVRSLSLSTARSVATIVEDVAQDGGAQEFSNRNKEMERQKLKQSLLGRLGGSTLSTMEARNNVAVFDPVLADPLTKEPLSLSYIGPILGGGTSRSVRVELSSSADLNRIFAGRTDTYINLLETASSSAASSSSDVDSDNDEKVSVSKSPILASLLSLTPPPLRTIIANVTNSGNVEYIPMRDLFTSPSVSFAYERGWRQGFAAAGFPGADKEFELANKYFAPVVARKNENGEENVLVDMSCATGLFTRRFAKSKIYSRVIGCDYSDSMLTEARRRIRADSEIASSSTKLDLVRCDVAKIPMKSDSIDVFHAGAAMHCWPEIEASLKEIHRVLIPGGRYFATTFLSNYFSNLANVEKASNGGSAFEQNMQAFQYFPSKEYIRDLLVDAGFEESKVAVEVLGRACVIIRCEK